MQEAHHWYVYSEGETIGTVGTENGTILLDEEYSLGARITLEKNGYHPWAIVCVVYGSLMHTTFASSEEEAHGKYEAMKSEIARCLDYVESDAVTEAQALKFMLKWCKNFTDKFL